MTPNYRLATLSLMFSLITRTKQSYNQEYYTRDGYDNEEYKDQHYFVERRQSNREMYYSSKCYSCMSSLYEHSWTTLHKIYKAPLNFTDRCNSPRVGIGLKEQECGDRPCVSVFEPRVIGGYITDWSVMRGCSSKWFANGEGIRAYLLINAKNARSNPSCQEVDSNVLLPSDMKNRKNKGGSLSGSGSSKQFKICSCYGDRCNSRPTDVPDSGGPHPKLPFLTVLLMLIISMLRL